ncbi:MAG: penicillin-binding protein, partial [Bacteroidota bacterium]
MARIRNLILIRIRVAFAIMGIFALTVVARIGILQFQQGEIWASRAVGLKHKVVEATRGSIYADDGSLLAASLPYYDVVFDPTVADQVIFEAGLDSLATGLSKFFGVRSAREIREELLQARINNRQYVRLGNRKVDFQERKKLLQLPILREGRRKGGIIFEKTDRRVRPFGALARRTIGFIKEEAEELADSLDVLNVEGRGLEYSFNRVLSGIDGEALYQKIAGGYWIPVNDGTEVRPEDGFDIHTTLDLYLQDTAQSILRKRLKRYNANYGVLMLMETKTGALRAVVNLGRNSQGDYVENNSFAFGDPGLAEPGSTFKLMSMMALFEHAPVTLLDTVDTGNGIYKFYEDAIMRDVNEYGKLTIQQIFEKSSNVGMSKLIWKYFRKDPEKFTDYLRKFHIDQQLDVQMVGEATPLLKFPSDSSWSGSTLPWMSIGYEMLLSPAHTLAFYNAVANDGKMIQPYLVKKVAYANEQKERFKAKVLSPKVCSKTTLEIVKKMLEGTVEKGTARNIYTEEYKIAGKTGTAEKVRDGKYTQDHYTSFAGYFPADDPQYTCIVVIDNPRDKNDRYGGDVAAPVFREFAEVVYHQRVNPTIETLPESGSETLPLIQAGKRENLEVITKELGIKTYNTPPLPWVRTKLKGDSILLTGVKQSPERVPNVIGMTLRDALFLLENRGLKVTFAGRGRVEKQSLSPNSTVRRGQQ